MPYNLIDKYLPEKSAIVSFVRKLQKVGTGGMGL